MMRVLCVLLFPLLLAVVPAQARAQPACEAVQMRLFKGFNRLEIPDNPGDVRTWVTYVALGFYHRCPWAIPEMFNNVRTARCERIRSSADAGLRSSAVPLADIQSGMIMGCAGMQVLVQAYRQKLSAAGYAWPLDDSMDMLLAGRQRLQWWQFEGDVLGDRAPQAIRQLEPR